jgi:hypothetical protein
MTWPHVASRYRALFSELAPPNPLELVTSA